MRENKVTRHLPEANSPPWKASQRDTHPPATRAFTGDKAVNFLPQPGVQSKQSETEGPEREKQLSSGYFSSGRNAHYQLLNHKMQALHIFPGQCAPVVWRPSVQGEGGKGGGTIPQCGLGSWGRGRAAAQDQAAMAPSQLNRPGCPA